MFAEVFAPVARMDKVRDKPMGDNSVTQTEVAVAQMSPYMPYQLRPDYRYTIYLGDDNTAAKLADIFVVDANNSVQIGNDTLQGRAGGTEYWYYSNVPNVIGSIASVGAIFIEATQLANDPSYDVSSSKLWATESTANKGAWSQTPQLYPSSSQSSAFWITPPGGNTACWGLELNIAFDAQVNGYELQGIQWYRYDPNSDQYVGTMSAGKSFVGKWTRGDVLNSSKPHYFAQTSM